jgi:hypothetical protein
VAWVPSKFLWRLGHNTGITQKRMIDQRGLEGGDSEAGADGRNAECDHEGDRTAQHRHDRGDDGERRSRPPRRFMLGGEVEDNARAERDGEPRQQATGADLGQRPFADARGNGEFGLRPNPVPRTPRPPDRPSSYAGPSAAFYPALVHHRAPLRFARQLPALMLAGLDGRGECSLNAVESGQGENRAIENLSRAGGNFRPGVAQADGAVEDQPIGFGIPVATEITLPLELHRVV